MKAVLRICLVALGLFASSSAWATCGTGVGTCFWIGGGSSTNWSATGPTNWSATTGGAANATAVAAGDAVVFDANSGTGTSNISASISIASLTASASTAVTLTHAAAVVLTVSGNTFNLNSTIIYAPAAARAINFTSTSGTTTITTNGQTLGTITFNGVAGDFVLAGGTFNAAGGITLTNGTLDDSVNNVNVTALALSSSNANTRVLNCGTGTWTLNGFSGTINVWDYTTTTGLTSSCGSASITIAPAGTPTGLRTFATGGASFGSVTITGNAAPTATGAIFSITGAPTFSSLTVTGSIAIELAASTTYTITNAFTGTGTAALPILLEPASPATATGVTLSIGAASTCTWCGFVAMKLTGAGTLTTTNSQDYSGNTGFTITPPSSSSTARGGILL